MIWKATKLDALCSTITKGTTPRTLGKEYVSSGIPFLRAENLQGDSIKLDDDTLYIDDDTNRLLSRSLIRPGDVLISIAGTIGRSAIVPDNAPLMNCNQAVAIVRISGPLDSRYLLYWLKTDTAQLQMAGAKVTQTISNLSLTQIGKLSIPLPPLSEQRLIVEILDKADVLYKKRVEADAKAEKVLPAVFYKIFGDPVANSKNLNKRKLGDLVKFKSGNFLPAKDMETEGRYPVYGGNGINGYHSEYMFEGPVIVVGRVGVYCGVVYYTEPKSWVTDNALYVSEHSNELNPRYLAEALRLANLNQYAGRAGQPLISGNRIYPVEILVPSMPDQKLFARRIEELTHYKDQRRHVLSALDKLFSVLMHRAFLGELTSQWREAHMKELLSEMEEQAKYLRNEASA